MSRDHTKLRVFHAAHRLTISIYEGTRHFPRDEWFGIRAQIRRAAVSIGANLVEGSARRSTGEYCSFLNVALASACELAYLVGLATELGYLDVARSRTLASESQRVVRQMQSLVDATEVFHAAERASRDRGPRVRPQSRNPPAHRP